MLRTLQAEQKRNVNNVDLRNKSTVGEEGYIEVKAFTRNQSNIGR